MGCMGTKPLQKVGGTTSRDCCEIVIPNEPTRSHVFSGRSITILNWKVGAEVGRGTFSRVYRVQDIETDKICAAKVYDKAVIIATPSGRSVPLLHSVQRQLEVMAAGENPHILPIIEVIDDDVTNTMALICPLADCNLCDYALTHEPLSDHTLAICFRQVAEAMQRLHSLNIVHRDLRPEKILVFPDEQFCVAGFGAAAVLDSADAILDDTRGAPEYLAPEERSGDPFLPKPADVWAFGATLLATAFGEPPGNEIAIPETASDGLRGFLEFILRSDPRDRPTFEAILEHEWMSQECL